MSRAERWLRWSPVLVFALYVIFTIGYKYSGERRVEASFQATDNGAAAAECELICGRLTECALEVYGDSAANRDRLPMLRMSCYSGCLKHSSKISSCFRSELNCIELTGCAVQLLYTQQ
jgi:Cys-rich protein (TIGR04453 family)